MDPNQTEPVSSIPPAPQQDTKQKISQASGEFIHNNYETWLRTIVNAIISGIKFVVFVVKQVINQIFSK